MKTKLDGKNPRLLVEYVHMKSGERIDRFIRRKAERIFRRYPKLEAMRMNIKRDSQGRGEGEFTAQARLVLPGYDRIIEKRGGAVFAAIANALDVADRQLKKQSRRSNRSLRFEAV